MPCVQAVVVNYHGAIDTIECLDSLKAQTGIICCPMVVDNASGAEDVASIRAAHPDVEIVIAEHNLGFCGGNNVAIEMALKRQVDYLFLVNNDTTMDSDCLQKLVLCAQAHPEAAVVAPAIYRSGDKTPWFMGALLDMEAGSVGHIETDVREQQIHDPYETPWVTGCAMLIPSGRMREVGSFDPRFFCYYEDVDWSMRARRLGYSLLMCPTAILYHKVSATSDRKGAKRHYYETRNQFLFFASMVIGPEGRTLLRRRTRATLADAQKMIRRPAPSAGRRRACASLLGIADFYLRRFGPCPYSWL